jgi:hypothetical protein
VGRRAVGVLYVLVMVAVIVGVDILFFRNHIWERLIVNIGIVLIFGAFYLRFLNPRERSRRS